MARFITCSFGLLALAAGCGGSPESREPSPPSAEASAEFPLAEEAVRGTDDPELAALLRDHWDWTMRQSPVWATTLGDHRFDDRLADPSDAAQRRGRREAAALLARARAIDPAGLTDRDRVTRQLFIEELDLGLAGAVCDAHLWSVSVRGNPLASTATLPQRHEIRSEADARNLIARYRRIPSLVDATIANLELGAERGMVANRKSVELTIEMVERQLAQPVAEWSLSTPIAKGGLDAVPEAARDQIAAELRAAVEEQVAPAFSRYLATLRETVLPGAREADEVGVHALPRGARCYQARIRQHLGLERSAAELHALGLAEIERINAEMRALGRELFDTGDLAEIVRRLRTDPELYFDDAAEIVAAAEGALAAARAAIPGYFGILPESKCVVVEIPEYEAPFTTIAYYVQPHADGSKPGEYFVNTYKPEVRPRYEARVLAYHESIPGHHLQIAISQERSELPAFRRFLGITAFVEGWALYTERLAAEMGLYATALDRMGMLSYDAWRAARLVVDTGIHAKGWTRERAEEFLRAHTALTEENIRNEVDRYISWPGQALAYKVGQLEIVRLRERAREALGERFDIREFHDVVLGSGAVSLSVLADNVERYVKVRSSSAASSSPPVSRAASSSGRNSGSPSMLGSPGK